MIKRLVMTAMVMVMSVGLLACGENDGNIAVNQENQSQNHQSEEKGYVFESAGTAIEIDTKVDTYTSKLGEPKGGYYEAKSCAFDGLDKFWYYDGFTIQAYQKDGEDLVYMVSLTDDTVKTKEGVKIGDTKDKMISVYGSGYKVNGTMYFYEAGNMMLEFTVKDDTILSIVYMLKAE